MTYTVIYRTGTIDDYRWDSVPGVFWSKATAKHSVGRVRTKGALALVVPTHEFRECGLPTSYKASDYELAVDNDDDELGYKLAMVMMTGHSVRRYEGSAIHFDNCLNNIKKYICPDMNIETTAKRIIKTIDKADASWDAFFERRRRILCAWCKSWVALDGTKQQLSDDEYEAITQDPSQSHGVCKQCADKVRDELETYRRKEHL